VREAGLAAVAGHDPQATLAPTRRAHDSLRLHGRRPRCVLRAATLATVAARHLVLLSVYAPIIGLAYLYPLLHEYKYAKLVG
jgi:hypothetical protein